jgi:hypothetical protein
MLSISERLARCEREIALAIVESNQPHTEMEHAGILLWEMDWRIERETILAEMTVAQRSSSATLLEAKHKFPCSGIIGL